MGKLLKMEFRRLFRCCSFYSFPAVIVVILIIERLTLDQKAQGSVTLSWVFGRSEQIIGFAIAAAGIMAVYHWSLEYKKGYIKNIAGSVGGKHLITLSKLIIGSFVMIVYAVFSFVFGLFFALINYEGIDLIAPNPYPLSADELSENVRSKWMSAEQWDSQKRELLWRNIAEYFLYVLAGIAIIALALLLFELFRSAALSYIIVISIGFNILESLICNIVALINPDLQIAKHLLLMQFYFINGDITEDAAGELVASGPAPLWIFWLRTGLYAAVFLGTAVLVSRKKDTA